LTLSIVVDDIVVVDVVSAKDIDMIIEQRRLTVLGVDV
jgi:hypothetical protein